jgi:hypothetical protein
VRLAYTSKDGIGAIRMAIEGASTDSAAMRIIEEILAAMAASRLPGKRERPASRELFYQSLKRSGVPFAIGDPPDKDPARIAKIHGTANIQQ